MKKEIFDAALQHIKKEMSWNICNPDLVYPFSDEDKAARPEAKNPFTYQCYPGESIITEMREAVKKHNPKMKIITLDFINWGDIHEYEFDLQYRKGKEPDEPIEDDTDYSETAFKMDKFMSDDPDDMNEYETINSVVGMVEFLELHMVDEDRFHSYIGNGNIKGFAEYLISERTAIPGTEGGHQMK